MGLNRSSYYLSPATESEENLRLMRLIDQQFLRIPFYGSRQMMASLERSGETVNRKRVQRLMALMGLDAIFPKPRTTVAAPDARVYPYLLRDRVLTHVNEVWSSDITYVLMKHGFMYLTAVIDWFSRYVLSWRLSNTLEGQFCLEALDEALSMGRPEIFNTDQGSQFTARDYTSRLEEAGIAVSRDGRGRALDNVFVERLWRSVKHEDTPRVRARLTRPTRSHRSSQVPPRSLVCRPRHRQLLSPSRGRRARPVPARRFPRLRPSTRLSSAGRSGIVCRCSQMETQQVLPSSAKCYRTDMSSGFLDVAGLVT